MDLAAERIVIPATWHLEFAHAAGIAASRFLAALRDDEVILASPCSSCGRTFVPPKAYCEDCFVPTSDDWVPVGPEGVVEAFSITYAELPGYKDPPYAVCYVRPDGASTAIGNWVVGVDLDVAEAAALRLAIGTRARAVFAIERSGRITDFSWTPVDDSEVRR